MNKRFHLFRKIIESFKCSSWERIFKRIIRNHIWNLKGNFKQALTSCLLLSLHQMLTSHTHKEKVPNQKVNTNFGQFERLSLPFWITENIGVRVRGARKRLPKIIINHLTRNPPTELHNGFWKRKANKSTRPLTRNAFKQRYCVSKQLISTFIPPAIVSTLMLTLHVCTIWFGLSYDIFWHLSDKKGAWERECVHLCSLSSPFLLLLLISNSDL